ncbi:MAG: NAD(P)H-dependent flavin oxidoreductase [Ardenticatenaceae bacterium]
MIDHLSIPLLQAPIGSVASPRLAAAVSNAGGMGSLALTWTKPEQARRLLQQVKERTTAPFFVNFVLAFPPRCFDVVLQAGVPAITFSWGHAPELMRRAQQKGISVGVQVGNLPGAMKALDDGADFIICQGVEAGGHVQSTTGLISLLTQVLDPSTSSGHRISRQVPVIAAGGLSTGFDMFHAMQNGAAGVMMGTRFVATRESRAHNLYKEALIEASPEDTAYTICFDGGWPQAAHRVLRNSTFTNWEAAGCSPKGSRPGEGEVVATLPSGGKILRYDDSPPLHKMKGDLLDCCLYAGQGVDGISDVPSAHELVHRLWQEAQSFKVQ